MLHSVCTLALQVKSCLTAAKAWPTSHGGQALTCASSQQCQEVIGVLASHLVDVARERLQQLKGDRLLTPRLAQQQVLRV